NSCLFFFQAEDGIRDPLVTGVQTCALPIFRNWLAIVVLPVPGLPSRRNNLPFAKPPARISSSPATPVAQFLIQAPSSATLTVNRSEERRVGKGPRSWC